MSTRRNAAPTEADIAAAAALLGVPAGTPAAEVKRAWRAAVRVTHPDRVDGTARRAAEHLAAGLNEARDILLAVAPAGTEARPFGWDHGAPHPPDGTWDAAVPTVPTVPTQDPAVRVRPAMDAPTQILTAVPAPVQAQAVPDLPRPWAAAPSAPSDPGAHPTASGRPRPVRETIGIVVLLVLAGAAAVLAVYQFLGGLIPH